MSCKICKIKLDRDYLSKEVAYVPRSLINYNAGKRGLEKIVCTEKTEAAAINILNASKNNLHSFTDYCFEHNNPILYHFEMKLRANVIVNDTYFRIKIAKKSKTGKYKNGIEAYIGRYVSFWSHQTPTSLLLKITRYFQMHLCYRPVYFSWQSLLQE
ncbi:hypothetical protein M2137_001854 [Parabacteroides sp. PFB2-10]|uniref:hypothetical protein n=1 Tax=Parabacteroides sp. PFB2-10 TaxID=1742405 RepID=UPI0024757BBF|nr:hypothetical protein [Parabacteroides sp. PFB2-10]MDH6313067.1 hypothetical protein [Parabacteroides sp. PFB2-10]MDL2245008.1 hypothetical protein [Parabacteroides sp. OttesenSCG-928-J18]MDL2282480.1 hypothetical protein [Parabacteroides sp. OttesenSCG-928-G06]